MDAASGLEWPESGRTAAGVAFDFPAVDTPKTTDGSPTVKVRRRIRRRLMMENRSGPSTAEEIEAKLREADLRRQQFHAWLSSKARPKPRSPSWSSQEEDLGQRLEAKLYAAEQKRLSLLAKAQRRLARLDELRQAAKTGVELRFEKEREKLGTKVESRVQQAEANRMLRLKANMQRRAAAQERSARSLLQRINRENKYRECIRSAICQKRAAAEKKRLRLLEAEKTRARARVMQVHRVAKSVYHQREIERRRMKEQLEDRLQRAKRQRAEYLRQRGNPHGSSRTNWNKMQKHGDFLSRKLARCWRQFVRSRRTTFSLAKAFQALDINENFVRSMPFEQLAVHIESATTLRTVKAFLDRLETRFKLSHSSSPSGHENLDHLLKRLGSPSKRGSSSKAVRTRGQTKKGFKESKSRETPKLSRYPVRVVLCAYMISGHPDAVFSGQGERENELAESAANFIQEFELLVKIILDEPDNSCSFRKPLPESMLEDPSDNQVSSGQLSIRHTFRSQLAAFDAVWHSYLYRFVVWKVKDARSLEDDLVRAACQLELSMMQTCKITSEREGPQGKDLTHDMRAIQKQVTEDQQLLREKVKHLSGTAGIERLESALSDTRSRFFEAKDNGANFVAPVAHISSPLLPTSPASSVSSPEEQCSLDNGRRSSSVVRSFFVDDTPSLPRSDPGTSNKDAQSSIGKPLPQGNEILVNEILHDTRNSLFNSFDVTDEEEMGVQAKIKETMKKVFWDGILESLKRDQPDYGRIVGLVNEVKDELCEMAPQVWKQEICDSIDLEILTRVLESRSNDMDYLGMIMEYALAMLQKLSAPAKEDEMKKTHHRLLSELSDIAQSSDKLNSSFVVAVVKGLQFVLEEIQTLKKEMSKARISLMVPIIKGPAGLEYLQQAFSSQYSSPSDAANKLPLTAQWLSSTQNSLEEWEEHTELTSTFSTSQGLPTVTALRSGGSILPSANSSLPSSLASSSTNAGAEQPECRGEKIDVLVRLGLLKLASRIEGLSKETLPETLKLNFSRMRVIQGNLQNIVFISTSGLVLRQILLSENLVQRSVDVENIVFSSVRRLTEALEHTPDIGIAEIIDTIINSSSEEKLQEKKEVMASMLVKSLQAGDAVFERVSRSVYLSARAIVLGGSGDHGRKLADAALRRVGASLLLGRLVDAVEVLIVMAKVSGQVHRPWYQCLVQN